MAKHKREMTIQEPITNGRKFVERIRIQTEVGWELKSQYLIPNKKVGKGMLCASLEWKKKVLPDIKNLGLDTLGLNDQIIRTLERSNIGENWQGIRSVADLIKCTDVELLTVPGIGVSSIAEIKKCLKEHGLW